MERETSNGSSVHQHRTFHFTSGPDLEYCEGGTYFSPSILTPQINVQEELHRSSNGTYIFDVASDAEQRETLTLKYLNRYKKFPFLQTLLKTEIIRIGAMRVAGGFMKNTVKGHDGWFKTIFVCRERALDSFLVPWLVVNFWTVLWVIINMLTPSKQPLYSLHGRVDISVLFSGSLAFLLVFRLNRVAVRWWDVRTMWGKTVEQCRVIVSMILEHAPPTSENYNRQHYMYQAVGWVAAFPIAMKQFLRGEESINPDELSGFLTVDQVELMESSQHPALYAASEIRHNLKRLFYVNKSTPFSVAVAWSSQMRMLEESLMQLIASVGGMERIKSTPLPIVYVTHLRTFLFLYLLLLPLIYVEEWGWNTVPAIALLSFGLLGIDGAAHECERPFEKGRANHMDMEGYCCLVLKNILQLMIHSADMKIREDDEQDRVKLPKNNTVNEFSHGSDEHV